MADKNTPKKLVGIGTGLAVLAAGIYLLYGDEDSKKRRKAVKEWADKAKEEAVEKLEQLETVDEKTYQDVIDAVAKRFQKMRSVDEKELEDLQKDLKKHWKEIQKELDGAIKKPRKTSARKRTK